jgi:aminomethyltransferase
VKRTAVNKMHHELGGRMVEFAGWDMPIMYTSIIDEHMAVREGVGLFDVSHMGDVTMTGKDTIPFMRKLFTNDAARSEEGEMKYTLLCNEKGLIIDDMIFYKRSDTHFFVIPNGATDEKVFKWFKEQHEGDVDLKHHTLDWFCFALQGPKAIKTLAKVTKDDVRSMKFFTFKDVDLGVGDKVMTCRSGYTGEDGFELVGPNEQAEDLWKALMDAGKEHSIKPIGLGARDTLRLEKGFLLSGTDFNMDRTPLEAGVDWAVKWDHDFIGKEALLKQKDGNDFDRFRGLLMIDKGIPRHGCRIEHDGNEIGTVTSGTMSPVLRKGIALGYIKRKFKKAGKEVDIVVRDKRLKAEVVKPPFVANK